MKIISYKKLNANKYKITIENHEDIILYDDIILKYNLLLTKNISEKDFTKIVEENKNQESYYKSIKYLSNKNRCEKEIKDYLKRCGFNNESINNTIKRLKEKNYLNEDVYLKSFINDEIKINRSGPEKIKRKLQKLGFNNDMIDEYLKNVDDLVWQEILEKIILKKIKLNHNKGINKIKEKILFECLKDGFNKENIINILNTINIPNNHEYLEKETKKLYEKLSLKYTGYELEIKIKTKLINKGFTYDEVNEVLKDFITF